MSDEQNQQDPQPATEEASATPGEPAAGVSFAGTTGTEDVSPGLEITPETNASFVASAPPASQVRDEKLTNTVPLAAQTGNADPQGAPEMLGESNSPDTTGQATAEAVYTGSINEAWAGKVEGDGKISDGHPLVDDGGGGIIPVGEAGGATAGEFSVSAGPATAAEVALPATGSFTAIAETAAIDTSGTSDRSTTLSHEVSGDAPAVAQPGEVGSQSAAANTEAGAGFATLNPGVQGLSGAQVTGSGGVNEPGEGVASPAESQSASGTSSSASLASPVAATLEEGASDVKSAIARLRDHLWTFEHSAVRHLHAELDKIEAWFK